ncbi:MAG: TIR domain-containing protein, partial [Actinobacteria bacterium]|nr:TIR domain-containing protein [Actinomycetota bacterium]
MRVFVSHAGRDRAWAEWVAWQLEHAGWGVSVELDCWDWQAGDNFVAKMNSALGSCDHMVALCSQAYYEPVRWTNEEWTAALLMAKDCPRFLVPVRIDDSPAPPLLAGLITPALHGLPLDQARATLLGAIRPPDRSDREPPLPGRAGQGDGQGRGDGPRLPGVLPPVWGPVPARNEAFTGRDGMLMRLREGLQGSGRSVVHALHGAGGVGKTQLATEYAWRFANDYDAVWWVNAEQADRISEQYAAFAVAWGLVDPATQVGPAIDTLRAHCRSRGKWLVVLDNTISARAVHHWLLPGPGQVLVTSRDPHWPPEMGAAVSVDVFARGESIALLHAHLPTLPDQHANRLAQALGDLPLALTQAAGVLSETGMPVTEYLELLDTTGAEVLDEGTPISYPRSLATSLQIAVEQLTSTDPAAAQLLRLCASLAPDPIPTRWFSSAGPTILPEPLATTVAAPLAFRRTLGLLSRYGLAKLADDHLTVHRLTQHLLRADTTDPRHPTTIVGNLLADLSPGRPIDPTTWPAWA